jgi:NhaP-type Na+/H+ or K+/H+ antiporter
MIAWIAGPLLGLTLLEGILLGSVLAAVSPAVVVPLMIRFIKERRGAEKSIPSLVMAAASVDDIYVIVVHCIALGAYVGAQTNMGLQLASIPISLLLGGAAGFVLGLLFCMLFDRFNPRATKRALMIIAAAVVLEQVPHWFDDRLPFAGLVGAMAIGYVILERREHAAHAISAKLAKVWVPAEIILFALVGAQVDLSVAWQVGLTGVGVIVIGLAARAIGVQCCLLKSSMTWGERGFVTVAFSPKATVQAAIGALPLIAMQERGMNTAAGETILALAVMSIILTAPTGAWAISAIGKRVLKVGPETTAYQAAIESEG